MIPLLLFSSKVQKTVEWNGVGSTFNVGFHTLRLIPSSTLSSVAEESHGETGCARVKSWRKNPICSNISTGLLSTNVRGTLSCSKFQPLREELLRKEKLNTFTFSKLSQPGQGEGSILFYFILYGSSPFMNLLRNRRRYRVWTSTGLVALHFCLLSVK